MDLSACPSWVGSNITQCSFGDIDVENGFVSMSILGRIEHNALCRICEFDKEMLSEFVFCVIYNWAFDCLTGLAMFENQLTFCRFVTNYMCSAIL